MLKDSDGQYLVVNKSCDLERFWKNGLGNLILIPLHEWGEGHDSSLAQKFSFSRNRNSIKPPTSLTNPNLPGCFLLPFIPNVENSNMLLVGAPSEITSRNINPPEDIAKAEIPMVGNRRLKYEDMKSYERHVHFIRIAFWRARDILSQRTYRAGDQ
ncbi:MAG: hypothetical protein HC888_16540 [Candidatus Competibacteraceae bacterium]|nr:hypothetical protein [Candidatus Competibacteraceae bacterium]